MSCECIECKQDAEISKLRAEVEQLQSAYKIALASGAEFCRQRDEARAERDKAHAENFETRQAHANTTTTLGKYSLRLDEARAEVEQLTRERDEANDRATMYGNMARMVLDQKHTTEELDRMMKELGL